MDELNLDFKDFLTNKYGSPERMAKHLKLKAHGYRYKCLNCRDGIIFEEGDPFCDKCEPNHGINDDGEIYELNPFPRPERTSITIDIGDLAQLCVDFIDLKDTENDLITDIDAYKDRHLTNDLITLLENQNFTNLFDEAVQFIYAGRRNCHE